MNTFTYQIARDIAVGLNGGSLPAEFRDVPPSTDPAGDLNLAFGLLSAELLNWMNLPGIPRFEFG